jgi:hypothetical protein
MIEHTEHSYVSRTLPHQDVAQTQMQQTRMQKPPPQQTVGNNKACQKILIPRKENFSQDQKNIETNEHQLVILDIEINNADHHSQNV